jgi:hypothetical protein
MPDGGDCAAFAGGHVSQLCEVGLRAANGGEFISYTLTQLRTALARDMPTINTVAV